MSSARDRNLYWASLPLSGICQIFNFTGDIKIELARANRNEKCSVQKHIQDLVALFDCSSKKLLDRIPSSSKLPEKIRIIKERKSLGPTPAIKFWRLLTLRPQKSRKVILDGLLRTSKKLFSRRRLNIELSWIYYQRNKQ